MLFAQASFGAPLIIGVSPSLPKPVAELEIIVDQKKRKKLKFSSNKEQLEASNTPPPRKTSELLPTKHQAWQNIFNFISEDSSLELKFIPAKSQLDFELKLAKGFYDLAYITPLQFQAFRDYPGYQAQVKRKSQPIRGMIFVKKNGPITTLTDLRDATIAFPGLLNFPASIVPRESLQRLKVNIIPQFLASDAQVYAAVAKGQQIAGGGTEESFRAQPAEIQNSLRMIWDTPGFSPYALVAHPRVDFFSLTRLKRALVNMNNTEEGAKLLKYIFVNNGFEVARNSDWDEIKLIDLNTLNGDPERVHAPEPQIGM
jgi:ABC-type phosphate/phosphonate transport system substrate-binding protein